jgi:nucleoside 2-deoxyribosyltransferase
MIASEPRAVHFYVAGKTYDLHRVRQIQGMVRAVGHVVTYDWTTVVEATGPGDPESGKHSEHVSVELERECALRDLEGVQDADIVIALGHPQLAGTWIEIGAALAHGKQVWFLESDKARHTVFVHHPLVRCLTWSDLDTLLQYAGRARSAMLTEDDKPFHDYD